MCVCVCVCVRQNVGCNKMIFSEITTNNKIFTKTFRHKNTEGGVLVQVAPLFGYMEPVILSQAHNKPNDLINIIYKTECVCVSKYTGVPLLLSYPNQTGIQRSFGVSPWPPTNVCYFTRANARTRTNKFTHTHTRIHKENIRKDTQATKVHIQKVQRWAYRQMVYKMTRINVSTHTHTHTESENINNQYYKTTFMQHYDVRVQFKMFKILFVGILIKTSKEMITTKY